MVKDGEDWHGLQTTKLSNRSTVAVLFELSVLTLSSSYWFDTGNTYRKCWPCTITQCFVTTNFHLFFLFLSNSTGTGITIEVTTLAYAGEVEPIHGDPGATSRDDAIFSGIVLLEERKSPWALIRWSVWTPSRWLARKIIFWSISGTEVEHFWNWVGKSKYPGALPLFR